MKMATSLQRCCYRIKTAFEKRRKDTIMIKKVVVAGMILVLSLGVSFGKSIKTRSDTGSNPAIAIVAVA
jgi:hypothetical protein